MIPVPVSHPALPELPSSSTSEAPTESLLTSTAAGATIVGMVGFSLLLYKNATMVRTIVNAGYRLLQSCLYKTSDSLKTATNFYWFHSPFKAKTRITLQNGFTPVELPSAELRHGERALTPCHIVLLVKY